VSDSAVQAPVPATEADIDRVAVISPVFFGSL
jgi:hypothetical protein